MKPNMKDKIGADFLKLLDKYDKNIHPIELCEALIVEAVRMIYFAAPSEDFAVEKVQVAIENGYEMYGLEKNLNEQIHSKN